MQKKPVIGFEDAGGFQDIVINDSTGYLVEYESTDGVIEKIRLLCSDEKLREKLGNNAKEICGNYNFTGYVKVLKSCCDEGASEINGHISAENVSLNHRILDLQKKNRKNSKLILRLDSTNAKLKKDKRKLKKKNSKLKRSNSKLKKERKEILSSSSWKITSPLRKFKHSSEKIFHSNKNGDSSKTQNSQKASPANKSYTYSIKNGYAPLIYPHSFKIYKSCEKIKRVNLFFNEIDESIFDFEKLFSFLSDYCNQYEYSLRIIYNDADFEIYKEFLNKNNIVFEDMTIVNLKDNNYLEIGLDEKYVSVSWKNGMKLMKTPNINVPIYFYLNNPDGFSDEEYFKVSKLCYDENTVILCDSLSQLGRLKKFNYNCEFNVNSKLNGAEKSLCYHLEGNPLEGLELLNYLFYKGILDDSWKIDIISKEKLNEFYIDSKILTPIAEKREEYDIFLNWTHNENNISKGEDDSGKNYINLYFKKESDDSYNVIDISNDSIEDFHNFTSLESKDNKIDEIFNKFMEEE